MTDDDTKVTEPTQVEAETDATQDDAPETFDREYVEKLRAENAKWRSKLRERQEAEEKAAEEKRQAELSAEERAKEAERKAEEALTAAEQRVQTAERKAALAGKVSNPERVMRLMDDAEEYFNGSEPDVDAIHKAFPEYAPQGSIDLPGARTAKGNATLKPEDFKGKSQQWISENLHRLKPS